MGVIMIVLASIVGLAMIFYIFIRIARGSEELDIEPEEVEIDEEYVAISNYYLQNSKDDEENTAGSN